jgi:hypothetical protein
MLMCYVYAFSLHRESPDMIMGDERLIFEVVLSHEHMSPSVWVTCLPSFVTDLVVTKLMLSEG